MAFQASEMYWKYIGIYWKPHFLREIIFQPCEHVRPVFGTEKGSIPFAVL